MSDSLMNDLMPDPANGEVTKKETLLRLAKKHGILRIAAEKGLDVSDAIAFVEKHGERMAEADFPADQYHLLSGLGATS